jgi:uncharacterized protein (DUF849 family)
MFITAAINGARTRPSAPTVPLSLAEVAEAAVAAVAAGADVVHFHTRTADGSETIEPAAVAAQVLAIRSIDPAIVIGTTTGLWTSSGHAQRMQRLSGWPDGARPDFASVAFSEEGAADAARLVRSLGMQLESAIWSLDDVPALLESSTLHENIRILIEPEDDDSAEAVAHARRMSAALRAADYAGPLQYHGLDHTAWPLLVAAIEDGAQLRIGFEDVAVLPDGSAAPDNATLVTAAITLAANHAADRAS